MAYHRVMGGRAVWVLPVALLSLLAACGDDGGAVDAAVADGSADGGADARTDDGAVRDAPGADVSADAPSDAPSADVPATDSGPPPVTGGIWVSREEVMGLPMSGPAWDALLGAADMDAGTPNLSDQDQDNNVMIMAKALVFARTGDERYRTEVRQACMDAIGTEVGGRTLALGRELAAYVIAADLVTLQPDEDASFRTFLRAALTETLDGRTLVSTHEDRPNNWGTHAGASRAAVAVYLGDDAEVERTAQVFRGWLGDRAAYASFSYSDPMTWHADETMPVGINPAGAMKMGESIDGVIPDDMRRGCGFAFPPCPTGYPWESLQGALAEAEILYRRGYDTYGWSDRALLRAVRFLIDLSARYPADGWENAGDDEWQLWLVNFRYDAGLSAALPARAGKNVGWTDWTHDRTTRAP